MMAYAELEHRFKVFKLYLHRTQICILPVRELQVANCRYGLPHGAVGVLRSGRLSFEACLLDFGLQGFRALGFKESC